MTKRCRQPLTYRSSKAHKNHSMADRLCSTCIKCNTQLIASNTMTERPQLQQHYTQHMCLRDNTIMYIGQRRGTLAWHKDTENAAGCAGMKSAHTLSSDTTPYNLPAPDKITCKGHSPQHHTSVHGGRPLRVYTTTMYCLFSHQAITAPGTNLVEAVHESQCCNSKQTLCPQLHCRRLARSGASINSSSSRAAAWPGLCQPPLPAHAALSAVVVTETALCSSLADFG